MKILKAGRIAYHMSDSDCWNALAHASGRAFIELQQLEFAVISHLSHLVAETERTDNSFDVFASKTFGNLLREMAKIDFLKPLADKMVLVKEKRDFFVHRFLFHRFGGELTSDTEYEVLIRDAIELGDLFATSHTLFVDFMLRHAPLEMFAVKRDPHSGKIVIVESEFSQKRERDGSLKR